MIHTIEDMKSAYVFFNDARLGGSLPSPYGWRMSLCVGHVDNGDAECSTNRDSITFSNRCFGNDIHRDLYLLFHEMWHIYAGWEPSSSAYQVAISSHSGAWAAGMAMNDIQITSDVGHATVIPGGSFDRLRDAWIEQWEQGAPHVPDHGMGLGRAVEAQPTVPFGAIGLVAVIALLGMMAISGDRNNEDYYRGNSYATHGDDE
jgi:hypothetical protein